MSEAAMPPSMSVADARRMLEIERVARLATADARGRPHVVPVVFALGGDRVFLPIDHKPKRAAPGALRRIRNLRANPRASLLVDRYEEDWTRLAWVRVDGPVELVEEGADYRAASARLAEKYPQYRLHPLPGEGGGLVIVLRMERVSGWRAS